MISAFHLQLSFYIYHIPTCMHDTQYHNITSIHPQCRIPKLCLVFVVGFPGAPRLQIVCRLKSFFTYCPKVPRQSFNYKGVLPIPTHKRQQVLPKAEARARVQVQTRKEQTQYVAFVRRVMPFPFPILKNAYRAGPGGNAV
jgi:hypothetical protein